MNTFGLAAILAVSSWIMPQPRYSIGLLVVYGDQSIVRANAEFRGYNIDLISEQCGLAAISPAHLGQLAWVRVPGGDWTGPCLVVDAVSRRHAYESIFVRQEVAEISRNTAAALGFDNGGRWGYIFFGQCPPTDGIETKGQEWSDYQAPELYAPPLAWDTEPFDWTPSMWPYAPQQPAGDCG